MGERALERKGGLETEEREGGRDVCVKRKEEEGTERDVIKILII